MVTNHTKLVKNIYTKRINSSLFTFFLWWPIIINSPRILTKTYYIQRKLVSGLTHRIAGIGLYITDAGNENSLYKFEKCEVKD